MLVAAGAAAAVGLVRAAVYSGKALPGTTVAGSSVAGLGGPALERRIARVLADRLARPVTVLAGSGRITVIPGDVLRIDALHTAVAARRAGRTSTGATAEALLSPSPPRREVRPLLVVRPAGLAAVKQQLLAFAEPPRPAAVILAGTAPRAIPGRAGTLPDTSGLVAAIEAAVLGGSGAKGGGSAGPVTVPMRPAPPAISLPVAQAAVADAQRLLAGPVALRVGGIPSGVLVPAELAPALRFSAAGGRLVPHLLPDVLWTVLRGHVARFRSSGIDARLAIEGKRVRVVPAVDGLDIAPGTAAAAILAAMAGDRRTALLDRVPVLAKVTTADQLALGITTEVASYTTQMGSSSANRIHNVHLMADLIDGTIIRPGEVFSFNDVVGPRTVERGFLEGKALFGTVAVSSIGGGVCQTATTLFNDAFNLGLPILSRFNHSTYIEHYPVGRDATVSWGGPDFVFRNDLDHALLVKARYTDATLTFLVYGTPQGRRVIAATGPRTNLVRPQLRYALDLNARPKSVTLSRGSGAVGFDVVVTRRVLQHGKLLRADSFRSHYLDEGPTRIYGPGQVVPRPYIVIPKENV